MHIYMHINTCEHMLIEARDWIRVFPQLLSTLTSEVSFLSELGAPCVC